MSVSTFISQAPATKARVDVEDVGLLDDHLSSNTADSKAEVSTQSRLDPGLIRQRLRSPCQTGTETRLRTPSHDDAFVVFQTTAAKERSGYSGISLWKRHKGPILVFISQLFAALMNLAARLLELEDGGMHPMLVLFFRMAATVLFGHIYITWRNIEHSPWGPMNLRWALLLRGSAGFFGIYGMWYSMMYLPLAEATVITFLAPILASYLCHVFLHEPFTRMEQMATYLAFLGVILITRPDSLFQGSASSSSIATITTRTADSAANRSHNPSSTHVPTPAERLVAVAVGLLGVLGGSVVITVLRFMGTRAHPLYSVQYFSICVTIVTVLTLSIAPLLHYDQPELHFYLPKSIEQWMLLGLITFTGFMTQYTLAAGLGCEKSTRATAMIYTHMLFAAGFDKFVFGHSMGWSSLTGCGLIVGSALWIALQKRQDPKQSVDIEANEMTSIEGIPILDDDGEDDSEDETLQERPEGART